MFGQNRSAAVFLFCLRPVIIFSIGEFFMVKWIWATEEAYR